MTTALRETVIENLQCPICRSALKSEDAALVCPACTESYPIIEGIPDFYPQTNVFAPIQFNLKEKYEDYGEGNIRPKTFQNERRKKLTLEMVEGGRLLEIGAAEGWMTEELVRVVPEVVSSDIALNYLKRARAKGIDAKFLRLDAHYLPFEDGSFDSVLITEVLEHVYSPYRVLEEIYRVLKPGGKLILSIPNNLTFSNILQHLINRPEPMKDAHLSFYDMFSIRQLLEFAGFKAERSASVVIYLPVIKKLFHSHAVQNVLQRFFKNFGDKLIIKAVKTDETLWTKL